MDTNTFIKKHFQTAYLIHEECNRLNLSPDDARILTYIHIKMIDNNDDDYFSKEHETEKKAIEFLSGNSTEVLTHNNTNFKSLHAITERMKKLDYSLREEYGIETRISSELNNRMRLHSDPTFKNKMIALYREKILPRLKTKSSVPLTNKTP